MSRINYKVSDEIKDPLNTLKVGDRVIQKFLDDHGYYAVIISIDKERHDIRGKLCRIGYRHVEIESFALDVYKTIYRYSDIPNAILKDGGNV